MKAYNCTTYKYNFLTKNSISKTISNLDAKQTKTIGWYIEIIIIFIMYAINIGIIVVGISKLSDHSRLEK